ncbi:flagellar biosynthesis protein FlhF [Alkalicoccus daliensis]|uniref:Flagellar biosynthesis protein FlhF n=2 Tax=Alkalicoccus daliensis TaxID=745820 RepID=A0A1H0A5V9_9BACI|nr:flagellar biosynthesis protein FlhF [Alkalicoccus daliensis]
MNEAMSKVRSEMGQDAVILNSKNVETGGFLGFFAKNYVEVIAAIDPDAGKPVPKPPVNKTINKIPAADNLEMKKEIEELRSVVERISSNNQVSVSEYPKALEEIHAVLKSQEVKSEIRLQVMNGLLKNWYKSDENAPEEDIYNWLKEAVGELLPPHTPVKHKKYLNVFGPTGVGKTTTLAKIAAKAVVQEGKKVAFITTDTYRISAIEQLKTYADILNVPVEVAYSMEDFKKAKLKLASYDFILIDTAGRNFRNKLYVEQLKELIDFEEEMENHLVLSVTSKYSDMKSIINQFNLIKIDSFIFTKFDETGSTGSMINAAHDFQKPVSYITTGQNVPDDIIEAGKNEIVDFVLRSGT